MRGLRRRVQPLAAALLVLSLAVTACGAGTSALAPLRSGAEDAARLIDRTADPAELTNMSTRLDELLRQAPEAASLSASEQATVRLAAQRSALLKAVVTMLGASDEVIESISADAVELVSGSLILQPSRAFKHHLDTVAQRILKDTTCSLIADQYSALSSGPPSSLQGIPPVRQSPHPTQTSTLTALEDTVAAAGYPLEDVKRIVDLSGLSSRLLDTANGYVGRIKKTMNAASWQDTGALQAYWRHCVQ
ncbi:hypothetical protein [Citricoccus sp. I39-566]|uniref:hypothetical protein n=1 Tax=Citricoccus sp. I39-566 TaxID=3073268 RepID=UPI00286BB321|nr:hypothetical protein [Citricoccus sp. I39-566]WMY78016.1 hypothetical protein RE421_14495 [Citricoccus sp. I39-566]